MKKFISGLIVGALLFSGVSAFADGTSLIGKKVQGLFSVEKAGVKVADAVVINGTAYAPVRAVAEATGATLSIEGKKIIMGAEVLSSGLYDELIVQRTAIESKIKEAQGGVKLYENTYLPEAQQRYDNYKGTEYEQKAQAWLADRTKEYEQRKADLAGLQQQLADLDAQLAALQK
ncbi:hypothetical protein [Paenibacillus sp. NFR01]|uniref:hypothetical protein n=1 Tax=Paenibacillus sp. NFR01 TaxID=1566279 RepID=UPI0008AD7E70|nr:hypothetical protein [Paenibacillus sp. NFR01]SEU32794.1 hypothetical protein SAMN03159358_0156 [Paenibacillus sp. NFR01]